MKRLARIQNLAIVLLTLSMVVLIANLPLFGALSDRSLWELARDREERESAVPSDAPDAARLVFPVRIVYTNSFARLGADALTTLSGEFERAGTYLGEAIGSSGGASPVSEAVFLSALRGEGLYFDFPTALPTKVLSDLLGVAVPAPEPELTGVRRMLLCPEDGQDATLYVQDGALAHYRFSTAVSSLALRDYLASQSGNSADFAFLLGEAYTGLSPYTLVLSDPAPRAALSASDLFAGNSDAFLRRAGFNAHAENRFTESTGTVIVREVSSTLYLRPDGTVDYQGGGVAADSPYFVPAAAPDGPTLVEAATAAQTLVTTLLRDELGDAALYLSGVRSVGARFEITFDLMANGTPIRFSDGSHAVSVTVEGQRVSAFTLKTRRYTLTDEPALLLPVALSAAIARVYDGAELIVAYVDTGGESVLPVWIAEE